MQTTPVQPISWFGATILALFILYVIGGFVALHYVTRTDQRKRRLSMAGLFSISLSAGGGWGFLIFLLLWPAMLAFYPWEDADEEPPTYHGPKA